MPDRLRHRLRRVAMVVVLAVGTVAIAATTPPYTQVAIPSQSASFRLDPEHPAALSRFVVRIGAEARAGAASTRVILSIDAVRPRPITAAAGSQAIGFIVASTQQGASALPSPSAGSRVAPLASPWQAEPVPGREGIDLPIACGTGPCERGFWLIAELTAPGVDEADVDWHVSGSLGYSGGAYPSGPAASIQLDPAILLAGPAPKLTASTPTESLDLGPDRPAAAREVEVRVGPEAITHNGGPLGALSVDLTGPGSTGGVSGAQPVVHLYPLARLGGTSPPGLVLPSPVTQRIDPFADCRPGEECVRRFLVTVAWAGSHGLVNWQLTVRRADLVGVWSSPAELSATVVRRFDVTGALSKVHLEGDAAAVRDAPPQVQVTLATRTTTDDPLAGLLPVPGLMNYEAHLLATGETDEDVRARTSVSAHFPSAPTGDVYGSLREGSVSLVTNPFVGCQVGGDCGDLTVTTYVGRRTEGEALPNVRFHWSLDLTVYSFTNVPISLVADGESQPTGNP